MTDADLTRRARRLMDTRRDGSRLLESAVEAHLEKEMKKIGGRAYKMLPAVKGNPDRIVAFPFGRIYFVELKRPGEKPSPAQILWHQRSFEMGHVVHVLDTREMVDDFITWAAMQEDDPATASRRRHDELAAMKRRYK